MSREVTGGRWWWRQRQPHSGPSLRRSEVQRQTGHRTRRRLCYLQCMAKVDPFTVDTIAMQSSEPDRQLLQHESKASSLPSCPLTAQRAHGSDLAAWQELKTSGQPRPNRASQICNLKQGEGGGGGGGECGVEEEEESVAGGWSTLVTLPPTASTAHTANRASFYAFAGILHGKLAMHRPLRRLRRGTAFPARGGGGGGEAAKDAGVRRRRRRGRRRVRGREGMEKALGGGHCSI